MSVALNNEFAAELAAEVIQRTAGEKVLTAQMVRERAPFMNDIERRQYAIAWRAIAAVLTEAAAYVERFRPDESFIPEYLQHGSTVPLTERSK